MSVFVDTSGFYALLVKTEERHREVARTFEKLLARGRALMTSNYVLLETVALLQHRVGLAAVRDLEQSLLPLFRILWVGREIHRRATERLLRTDRRGLSLVDCVSFVLMESEGIRDVLALDEDFAREGYRVLPR